eukprot:2854957-Rhodomonas_salina.1
MQMHCRYKRKHCHGKRKHAQWGCVPPKRDLRGLMSVLIPHVISTRIEIKAPAGLGNSSLVSTGTGSEIRVGTRALTWEGGRFAWNGSCSYGRW